MNRAGLTEPMGLKIYRSASRLAGPVARFALDRRAKIGKEDPSRLDERKGIASLPRPDGRLTWIHGASVGESLSVLPLVTRLCEMRPQMNFLVTTGTVTSAELMAERLPESAIHQFVPLDHPPYVGAFMDHWRPDAALFVESEFWPNLIREARHTAFFVALINGRVSPKSFADWQSQPNSIRYILSAFDVIIAQDNQNAERLSALSGQPAKMFGNLKNAADPLPADENALVAFQDQLAERPRWLAASTHPGEEDLVVQAHTSLAENAPSLLTIIAPRHPNRGDEIAQSLRDRGLVVAQRSKEEAITEDTQIYLADTLGELGLFYRLSEISFVGGSINPKGGHNPLEPARLSTAILHGPETFNFSDTYRNLRNASGAALVRNERELSAAVKRLLLDEKTRSAMARAARNAAEEDAKRTLDEICVELDAGLPQER